MTILIPRPYQVDGINFLEEKKRGALWMSPGLGKTLQAGEVLTSHLPALVVTPGYLTWQWYDFLTTQYPGLSVVVAEGTRAQKTSALHIDVSPSTSIHPGSLPDVYITNIETPRYLPLPQRVHTFVIDEAHRYKGRTAQQSKAALLYASHSNRTHVIELTATPQKREADDLWMQLRILDPPAFKSYHKFVADYLSVYYHQGFRPIIKGIAKPKALTALVANYAHVLNYADACMDVPPLIPNVINLPLTPAEVQHYRSIRRNYRATMPNGPDRTFSNAFQVIDYLRHLTFNQAKIDAITNLVDDAPSDVGFLIYTHYIDHAHQIAAALLPTYPDTVCITGNTPSYQRIPAARASKHVVATRDSISEGGDLTHLKVLIYAEQDYTEDTQATGRTVRPTLDLTPVNRYDIIYKGTIDEVIYRCRTRRIHDAETIARLALEPDGE
jgi:superfamily II DNA or RNA helicase